MVAVVVSAHREVLLHWRAKDDIRWTERIRRIVHAYVALFSLARAYVFFVHKTCLQGTSIATPEVITIIATVLRVPASQLNVLGFIKPLKERIDRFFSREWVEYPLGAEEVRPMVVHQREPDQRPRPLRIVACVVVVVILRVVLQERLRAVDVAVQAPRVSFMATPLCRTLLDRRTIEAALGMHDPRALCLVVGDDFFEAHCVRVGFVHRQLPEAKSDNLIRAQCVSLVTHYPLAAVRKHRHDGIHATVAAILGVLHHVLKDGHRRIGVGSARRSAGFGHGHPAHVMGQLVGRRVGVGGGCLVAKVPAVLHGAIRVHGDEARERPCTLTLNLGVPADVHAVLVDLEVRERPGARPQPLDGDIEADGILHAEPALLAVFVWRQTALVCGEPSAFAPEDWNVQLVLPDHRAAVAVRRISDVGCRTVGRIARLILRGCSRATHAARVRVAACGPNPGQLQGAGPVKPGLRERVWWKRPIHATAVGRRVPTRRAGLHRAR